LYGCFPLMLSSQFGSSNLRHQSLKSNRMASVVHGLGCKGLEGIGWHEGIAESMRGFNPSGDVQMPLSQKFVHPCCFTLKWCVCYDCAMMPLSRNIRVRELISKVKLRWRQDQAGNILATILIDWVLKDVPPLHVHTAFPMTSKPNAKTSNMIYTKICTSHSSEEWRVLRVSNY
jgi:hypothetical protein